MGRVFAFVLLVLVLGLVTKLVLHYVKIPNLGLRVAQTILTILILLGAVQVVVWVDRLFHATWP